jgi:hypothetical protein
LLKSRSFRLLGLLKFDVFSAPPSFVTVLEYV